MKLTRAQRRQSARAIHVKEKQGTNTVSRLVEGKPVKVFNPKTLGWDVITPTYLSQYARPLNAYGVTAPIRNEA